MAVGEGGISELLCVWALVSLHIRGGKPSLQTKENSNRSKAGDLCRTDEYLF